MAFLYSFCFIVDEDLQLGSIDPMNCDFRLFFLMVFREKTSVGIKLGEVTGKVSCTTFMIKNQALAFARC